MLLVRYEDMLADPIAQLARIADTLGRKPTAEQLREAVDASELRRLKAQEAESGFGELLARDCPDRPLGAALPVTWLTNLPEEFVARLDPGSRTHHARLDTWRASPAAEADMPGSEDSASHDERLEAQQSALPLSAAIDGEVVMFHPDRGRSSPRRCRFAHCGSSIEEALIDARDVPHSRGGVRRRAGHLPRGR